MTNALAIYQQFDQLQRAALALYESRYFRDAESKAQAIVKVMAGAELGIPPFASMTGIHIIQGKPALGANVIATLIKNDPRYDYRVELLSDDVCEIRFYENGQDCGLSVFTAKDAQKAGVKNMQKFPRNMLFARAISNGAKWFTPGIFGGSPVYTPEELGADVDEDGNIVEGEVVQKAPARDVIKDMEDLDRKHDTAPEFTPGSTFYNGATVEHPDAGPLADDELAILEAPVSDYMKLLIQFVPRYDNAEAIKAAFKKIGVTSVSGKPTQRVEDYRALKTYAAERDAETIETD